MRKLVSIVLVALFLGMLTTPAFAAGGKNHGAKGQGTVVRTQVQVKK